MRRGICVLGLALAQASSLLWAQNGIDVGHAKVYDNRTLTLMLETLRDQLSQVKVVDQSALTTALGMLQGYQTQEVMRTGSIQVDPLCGPSGVGERPERAAEDSGVSGGSVGYDDDTEQPDAVLGEQVRIECRRSAERSG